MRDQSYSKLLSAAKCFAPARAQARASSLILAGRSMCRRYFRSKTLALRSFHSSQHTKMGITILSGGFLSRPPSTTHRDRRKCRESRPIKMWSNMCRDPSEDVAPDRQAISTLGEKVKIFLIMCMTEHVDFFIWPT